MGGVFYVLVGEMIIFDMTKVSKTLFLPNNYLPVRFNCLELEVCFIIFITSMKRLIL